MSGERVHPRLSLHAGDCLAALDELDAESFDACATDPPYHLLSTVKRFGGTSLADDNDTGRRARNGADAAARLSRGFMGKVWDGGDVAFRPETWAKVFRVLKPGAHLAAFAAPKCAHRMVCAIEDAGFEIRDSLLWMFGTGFPKSLDVSKAIDRAAGAEREVVGRYQPPNGTTWNLENDTARSEIAVFHTSRASSLKITAPATADAAVWRGWGTALKPAFEMICLARKPLSEATVARNVLRWGTGALNIDATRIETSDTWEGRDMPNAVDGVTWGGALNASSSSSHPLGRWPANVCHDGSAEVVALFPESDGHMPGNLTPSQTTRETYGAYDERSLVGHTDSGSAARFFFSAKADRDDRLGSKHPTVKPVDLMQWLVRLITPPGGLVLDPFAGTGATGEAAFREGMRAALIEREAEYVADIRRRAALLLAGPDARLHASIKARGLVAHPGPLFAEAAE